MTLVLQARGHMELAILTNVVSLFFGQLTNVREHSLDIPYGKQVSVISSVNPSVNQSEARHASRSGTSDRYVTVTTTKRLQIQKGAWQEADTVSEYLPLHDARRALKRQLYIILSRETQIEFPWGALTGVRPTQIALKVIRQVAKQTRQPDQIKTRAVSELIEHWHLSAPKAHLAVETALAEQTILSRIEKQDALLYVGLPFCPSRCLYCSFITQDAKRHSASLGNYVEAVIKESQGVFQEGFKKRIAAVYYGGGTPTSLPAPLFHRYLQGVLAAAPLGDDAERTMEAGRPDTIDREKLEIIQAFGFHKICINPQTMHNDTLDRIGRGHTAEDTLKAFQLARSMGFDEINMDLIAGLPGEGATELLDTLNRVIELGPENITLHTLAVKKGSYLDRLLVGRDAFLPDKALIDAVEQAHALLREHGYAPYYLYRQQNCRSGLENTGFTRRGRGSLYNVAMMSDQVPVIGLGSGATSKRIEGGKAKRLHNPKDLLVYMDRVDDLIVKKRALFSPQAIL
ncbi:MAG TPA: coproporphyrinogen dehydrogenase HemZ [Clostridia bacterium]|nr:coproporphyrinogen dehydrogenase HemZ [Clostridia bacterium]